MQGNKEYLTKEKFETLTRELEELKTTGRRDVAQNLEYAKSLGDLSENAEYQEAREAQATVEERIQKLEQLLKNVEIVKAHHTDAVDMGSIVHVQKAGEKEKIKYQIVGSEEANTRDGKISNRSPLGESMMGKKKGEKFSFTTPKGQVQYTIVDIE
jgi:transcription elongation factor GreA